MTLWSAVLLRLDQALGPDWRRMLLGVFLAGLGYAVFVPAFEGRQEAAQMAALETFASTGRLVLSDDARLSPDALGFAGPWPRSLAQEGRPGYARFAHPDVAEAAQPGPAADAERYRARPLTLALLAPVRFATPSWSWPARLRLYRVILWSVAMAGFAAAVTAAVHYRYLDGRGAALMAAWPLIFPQFVSQMALAGGSGPALACIGAASVAFMALSRRNDLMASLGLGLALGLGIWADALVVLIWAGLAGYLVWRGWTLHRQDSLDGEWLVLRLFAIGLALLIGAGWLIYVMTSPHAAPMTPVLGPGFLERLWAIVAGFSEDGGASVILPEPGWRLVPLALLVFILIRWEFHWSSLPPLARALAFILPLFTLSVLLLGLQGYAAGLEDLHMLAPLLALAFALCCRHSALALALIILGVAGVLAQGAIQASVFAGCALPDGGTGRYGYEASSCLLDWAALQEVSAPGLGLKLLAVGGLSALSALFTLWRQASWQSGD